MTKEIDKISVKSFDVGKNPGPDAEQVMRAVKYGERARKYKLISSFLVGAALTALFVYASMNLLLSNFPALALIGIAAGSSWALSDAAEKLQKASNAIFMMFAPPPPPSEDNNQID